MLRYSPILFGLLIASAAEAGGVTVRAGRLIDVERGRVLVDQAVVIREGRIVSVAPFKDTPQGALIDWSAFTVLPGLIDAHTHLVGDIQSASATAPLEATEADDALQGVAHARATLCAGFTAVRDVGTYRAFVDVDLRDAIEAGLAPGPRLWVAGAYITVPNGGGAITGVPEGTVIPPEMSRGVVRNAEEARAKARDILQHKADFLKLIATGAVLTLGTEPGAPELSEAEMRAAVAEAKAAGTYATAHAHGAEGGKAAIRAGVASIEHGSLFDDETLRMMKKRGVYLVADIYNGDYIDAVGNRDGWPEETLRKNRETTDTQREVFRKAVKMGVPIAYGTDAGVFPHGDNAKQFAYMVRYGMTPMQAIQSATIEPARLMRAEDKVGAVATGRFGDLIAVENDPLTNITALERVDGVMKGGVVVKAPGKTDGLCAPALDAR